jgi:hypothetical protein
LVIIVVICAEHRISGVDPKPILGGCICEATPKVWPFAILKVLRVVYKRGIVSRYIYFV